MPLAPQRLGSHLRKIRQANRKSQSELARELQLSRSAVAQMELGRRAVKANEIDRLAQVYGCSVSSLLTVPEPQRGPDDDDLVVEVAQAIPGLTDGAFDELRDALAVSSALTELEKKLGLEVYSSAPPSYGFDRPVTAWEAVHQGYVAAKDERRRMNLGDGPIRDLDETLAITRIRATKIALPESVSSVWLQSSETGILVVVNRLMPVEKRRFQYAHGFAHALFDHEHRWLVCRSDASRALPELRSCAFAGRFLIPQTGIQRYLQSLGKDTLGRGGGGTVQSLFSEQTGAPGSEKQVRVLGRGRRGATPIGPFVLTRIACYFGVSRSLAAHVLRNLRYITEDELAVLKRCDAEGKAARAQEALALQTAEVEADRDVFRSRLLTLAVEALAQEVIDRDGFDELSALVGLTAAGKQALFEIMDRVDTDAAPGLPSENRAEKPKRRKREQ